MSDDVGLDLVVGMKSARTFCVADSWLSSIAVNVPNIHLEPANYVRSIQNAWRSSYATAICKKNHPVPTKECTCGIYSFRTAQEVSKQYGYASAKSLAVVAPNGLGVLGSRGLRSSGAAIVAMWLSKETKKYNPFLPERYNNVIWYDSLARMLNDYPEINKGGMQTYMEPIEKKPWFFLHDEIS